MLIRNPIYMKSINRVTFLGHLAADPELKKTQNGKSVMSFAIATNNEWLDHEGNPKKSVDFHRIVAWETLADRCARSLGKGCPVYIEGRLSNRAYEGKDKAMHYITEVIANNVHLIEWQKEKKAVETQELAAA